MLEYFLKYILGENLWPVGGCFIAICMFFGLIFLFAKIIKEMSGE